MALVVLACSGSVYLASAWSRTSSTATPPHEMARDAPDLRGRLRVITIGGARRPSSRAPQIVRSSYVNGVGYSGMEDNDIRGFLDGRFKWGWNQAGQIHVRVGRRNIGPKYGEFEIMRVLQRWDEIILPPGAQVSSARLTVRIEEGASDSLRVMLYAVRPDWDPGIGGVRRDNVSPPNPGEVWWGDIGFEQRGWGLPGAGYASDVDPEADVGAMPLAEAAYRPGDSTLVFEASSLTRYVDTQSSRGESLRFLLKLADIQEDTPGAQLILYSASQGDDKTPVRRPRLDLEWSTSDATPLAVQDLHVEHGRRLVLPRYALSGGTWLAISMEFAEQDAFRPLIEIRGGRGTTVSEWQAYEQPISCNWDWIEVRVLAAQNPVVLGEAFVTDVRDTWVRTRPPWEQKVPWTFISPTGVRHEVFARYEGRSQWSISFKPDEMGPWRYFWTNEFTDRPYRGPDGRFDVIGGDPSNIERQLKALAVRVTDPAVARDSALRERLMIDFARLERAALQSLTPASFRGAVGARLRASIDEVRVALGGEKLPTELPLRPDPGPNWAQLPAP